MNQIIEMIPIGEFTAKEGKYKHLVKTKTFLGIQYLQANVTVGKKTSIDVSGQTVTHISKLPLYDNGND